MNTAGNFGHDHLLHASPCYDGNVNALCLSVLVFISEATQPNEAVEGLSQTAPRLFRVWRRPSERVGFCGGTVEDVRPGFMRSGVSVRVR